MWHLCICLWTSQIFPIMVKCCAINAEGKKRLPGTQATAGKNIIFYPGLRTKMNVWPYNSCQCTVKSRNEWKGLFPFLKMISGCKQLHFLLILDNQPRIREIKNHVSLTCREFTYNFVRTMGKIYPHQPSFISLTFHPGQQEELTKGTGSRIDIKDCKVLIYWGHVSLKRLLFSH